MTIATPEAVLSFWFEEIPEKNHWVKDLAFDRQIEARFGVTLEAAGRCELWSWRATPEGRLAEIIVLDQFSRNIHRDTPRAFAQDPLALALAQEAVASGADQRIEGKNRAFLYMPYMHSESRAVHVEALRLFSQDAVKHVLEFEIKHRAIVDRFGRYPHRNEILGRASTAEETAFLQQPDSSF